MTRCPATSGRVAGLIRSELAEPVEANPVIIGCCMIGENHSHLHFVLAQG